MNKKFAFASIAALVVGLAVVFIPGMGLIERTVYLAACPLSMALAWKPEWFSSRSWKACSILTNVVMFGALFSAGYNVYLLDGDWLNLAWFFCLFAPFSLMQSKEKTVQSNAALYN